MRQQRPLGYVFLVGFAIVMAAATGCTVRTKPVVNRAAPRPPTMGPPPPQSLPPAAPPPEADGPDPAVTAMLQATLAQTATALGMGGHVPQVTDLAIYNSAQGEAQGMRPDPIPMTTQLAEGQRSTGVVVLRAGECMTVIGRGSLGVVELDLFVTEAGADPSRPMIAQDLELGPTAIIGGKETGCIANPRSGDWSLEVHAVVRKGSGLAVIRTFRR